MKIILIPFILFQLFIPVFGQDLLKERIRKLSNNKTSIYVEKGIFHNGGVKLQSTLKSLRQSYNPKQGFERIVIDFTTNEVPKIYGHISSDEKKMYLDIFETNLAKDFSSPSNTRFVEKINFFPIESNHLSLDLKLKNKVIADIFTLENPGRLVIDFKN
ncbi:MAG: hypothetical protein HOP07_10930 [Bacteriovoracaceae bacterium]|nr:hypothetical protein [Bacteriovoracaceae bacterium]